MEKERDLNPRFIPGLELAEGFYREAVSPLLYLYVPHLSFSAGLIGSGSEVLGFDTEMSSDHHWGPRVMLFLTPSDLEFRGQEIRDMLSDRLPRLYRGYSTDWTEPDPQDRGTQRLRRATDGPVNHRVDLLALDGYFEAYLGIRLDQPLTAADWLCLPHQKLRSVCAGGVFRDDLGLGAVRDRLAWYPHDLWLYVLASSWARIGEEEHLTGRAGSAGDEIGSALIASRLVREIMRCAFLMERTWPPYAKWFGTAFSHLRCATSLGPPLVAVLHASSWEERDGALAAAYRILAGMHNALGLTPALPAEPSPFHGRPFTVIHGERFAECLKEAIRDEEVASIASRRLIGSIDQVSDSTDLLVDTSRRQEFRSLYGPPERHSSDPPRL